jgi:hypothetical protein
LREDNWRRETPLPRANPKLPDSPAKGYSRPEISKVAVAIESDEADFMPTPCDSEGSSGIIANIPGGSIVMPEGGTAVVDCGFALEVPRGYRCRVASAIKGVFLEVVDSKRFKVNAINLGPETILRDRESIGRIWIEPVHFFEWITKG